MDAMLADIPQKIVDESAFTTVELLSRCEGVVTMRTMQQKAKQNVASGKWEQVWKRGNNRSLCPAYRIKNAKSSHSDL